MLQSMFKIRIFALVLFVLAGLAGFFVYSSEKEEGGRFNFKLGLDLSGGSHLVYKADVSNLEEGDIKGAMESLKDVIERRVNLFGVSEPLVQIEEGGITGDIKNQKLIIELPGITDIDEAIKVIGETPLLEFKLLKEGVDISDTANLNADSFITTGLTGRYLERASVQFGNIQSEPYVVLNFNDEGKEIFADITKNNIGRIMPIFLDGNILSAPVIREEIPNGTAQISGGFTPQEAKDLVENLNYGALPVPIELVGTESVGASLGQAVLLSGIKAGLIGIILVMLFLILFYRLPGLVACLALIFYVVLMLFLFKLIPVTLTAAGIAGFIISIGMSIDANILIFERMKDEFRRGSNLKDSIEKGFSRAWFSIRDGNISSMITAIVLFWLGTSAVQGFALVFGLGVLVSMFSAITLTRVFLASIIPKEESKLSNFLFGIKTSGTMR